MIGTTLGHYKILDLLGKGGMGEVYRAEDTTLDREVALKVLPPDLSSDPDRLARFEREAKTLAALDHPNIVTIYSVESADVGEGLTPSQAGASPATTYLPGSRQGRALCPPRRGQAPPLHTSPAIRPEGD